MTFVIRIVRVLSIGIRRDSNSDDFAAWSQGHGDFRTKPPTSGITILCFSRRQTPCCCTGTTRPAFFFAKPRKGLGPPFPPRAEISIPDGYLSPVYSHRCIAIVGRAFGGESTCVCSMSGVQGDGRRPGIAETYFQQVVSPFMESASAP